MSDQPPKPGALYEHYKGNRYKIVTLAKHSETLEEMVVYEGQYGDHPVWVRPASMFLEEMEHDGKRFPRFKYIGE